LPVPFKLRLPPSTKKTFSLASILWLFKSILTVLLISNVSFKETFPVKLIVSVLEAALMASSRVSKNLFPILALMFSLAFTLIEKVNMVRNIKHK